MLQNFGLEYFKACQNVVLHGIANRDLESHTDCDDLSKIVQVPPNDSADVCYLQKTSIVDKLLDDRKNEFTLPTLKSKSHHVF